MKISHLLSLLTLLIFFPVCKKEKGLSKTEIVIQTPWIYKDAKRNGVSYFSTLPQCITDNIFTFSKNGALVIDEGSNKCDPNTPQLVYCDWYFFDQEDSISMYGFSTKVIELNEIQFITEITQTTQATQTTVDKFLYIFGKQ